MIITVTNESGGVEKSILANGLAMQRAMDGRNVLLIDGDPRQATLALCSERDAARIRPKIPARAVGAKGLQPELENLVSRYSDIVIDTEGRDSMGSRSALIAARVAVIPVKPNCLNPVNEKKLIDRIETARLFNPNLRVLFVIVSVKNELTAEGLARARALASRIPAATLASTIIHDQAVCDDGEQEVTVLECEQARAYAAVEIRNLYRELFAN